ncbi:MAG: FAD-binding oxidoreductase [Actinobacteria bacterium]|nr:FAD-binding oxidoreductase [Actinomycetota bacterium]
MGNAIGRAVDARDALAEIVRGEHVSDDPATLAGFTRDHSDELPIPPWFVVRPGDESQVRELVGWANATGTPLVPVSSGPPHFRGDTVPGRPGAVVVDLRRMKAIRRIDRRNKLAVIEPGVTYAQLQPALAAEGLRVVTPLRPRAGKSVIAALLEREPTLVPRYHYAFPEPLRNCGVVWGNGEATYTGEAGYGPPSLDAQWAAGMRQVDPKGPAQTDFVRLLSGAQGTLGIVTWASVKCTLLPETRKVVFVPAHRLEHLIGVCGRLQRLRLGEEVLLASGSLLASLMAPMREADRSELPPWTLVVGLAGRAMFPEECLAVQETDVREVVADLGREHGLEVADGLPGIDSDGMLEILTGVSAEPYWRLADKGDCREVFFNATLDKLPDLVAAALWLAEESGYPAADVGVYIQPQQQGVVHHCEFTLPFDPADADEAAAVRAFHTTAVERLAPAGAYFSRPYGPWANPVYARDGGSTAMLRTIKGVFDPNNVLNPGKLCFR